MHDIFEELIRKFAEASKETAGERFTPREVIELTVTLLLTDGQSRPLALPAVVTTPKHSCLQCKTRSYFLSKNLCYENARKRRYFQIFIAN